MRQLRFVSPGEDADHLVVETSDGGEQFTLLIDSALRTACQSDLPRLTPLAPESTAHISPREIQTRVRAGDSPQHLAEEHDVALEKVMRFAEPVLAERVRITDEARRARARRNGEGAFVSFGDVVDARFGTYGIDASLVRWDSRRREDGQWVVTAKWIGGLETSDDHVAEWQLNLATRIVIPLDDAATDLLSDRPITPVDNVDPLRPTLSAVPPIAAGVANFPAMPNANTGPLPGLPQEQIFDQAQFEDAPDVAPNPYAVDEDHADKTERARIPSWDDILLGVRRKGD